VWRAAVCRNFGNCFGGLLFGLSWIAFKFSVHTAQ
jgi:hypothetical protein